MYRGGTAGHGPRASSGISMSDPSSSSTTQAARGRGKSRGGLGKYLRARGRGRGTGRPAIFTERLLLAGEANEEADEEEAEERKLKYSKREITTNEDRYKELDIQLDSDGKKDFIFLLRI